MQADFIKSKRYLETIYFQDSLESSETENSEIVKEEAYSQNHLLSCSEEEEIKFEITTLKPGFKDTSTK